MKRTLQSEIKIDFHWWKVTTYINSNAVLNYNTTFTIRHFLLIYTYNTIRQFRGKYCTFYSTSVQHLIHTYIIMYYYKDKL